MTQGLKIAGHTLTVERSGDYLTVTAENHDFCRYVRVAGDFELEEHTGIFTREWTEENEEELWEAIRNS